MTEADRESHQVPIAQDAWEEGGSVAAVETFSGTGVDGVGRIPAKETNVGSWFGDGVFSGD